MPRPVFLLKAVFIRPSASKATRRETHIPSCIWRIGILVSTRILLAGVDLLRCQCRSKIRTHTQKHDTDSRNFGNQVAWENIFR